MPKPLEPIHTAPGTWQVIDLPVVREARGNLAVIEAEQHIPFGIDRVYYLFDVPTDSSRAGHAHKELQQLIVSISGSFKIHLDNGTTKETLTLDKPWRGLVLNSMVWREIDGFSSGCVCLVLASQHYTEADYYREYADFIAALK
jgi:hypothetical protein